MNNINCNARIDIKRVSFAKVNRKQRQYIAHNKQDKKLIRRWDSERELFYDDILHALQSTIDSRI